MIEKMTAENNPPRWVIQLPAGDNFMEHLKRELAAATIEAHPDSSRRHALSRLLDGCKNAKRIGTDGTVGTDGLQ